MPFAVIFIASSSGAHAFGPIRRLGVSVDRPLERIGRAPVVGPAATAKLGDYLLPGLDWAILPQLELGAPAIDRESHRGELRHCASIEGTVGIERPEAALGLVSRQQPRLLRRDRHGIL